MSTGGLIAGAIKGSFYGVLAGVMLGAAGGFYAPAVDHEKVLIWTTRTGKKTKFMYLDRIQAIKDPLLKVYNHRQINALLTGGDISHDAV